MKLLTILFACLVTDALSELRPGAVWYMKSPDYDGIVWLDEKQTKPTTAEVTQNIDACEEKISQRPRAVLDVNNKQLSVDERLDALIKAIDLK